jgi:hypothetical protein
MAAQLAPLKQCSPNGRIWYCGSAAPNAVLKTQGKKFRAILRDKLIKCKDETFS